MRATRRAATGIAAACVTLAVAVGGCGVAQDLPVDETALGSVDIGFIVSGRLSRSHMDYNLGGNGFGPVEGSIDLTNAASNVSAYVGGIPSGTGYDVSLAGVTDDQGTFCSGIALFDVLAPAPTRLDLSMICVNANTIRTTLSTDGVAHTCPAVASVAVSQGAGAIKLSGSAYQFDDAPVSYRWEATAGGLSTPEGAATTYTCGASGPQKVRFTAFDAFCSDLAFLDVTCP
ncbi:MAG TPA: hypothetical protein VHK47_05230 [Polyangia bacterium]|nr:hypothetical protein [Polyangia bacterium]